MPLFPPYFLKKIIYKKKTRDDIALSDSNFEIIAYKNGQVSGNFEAKNKNRFFRNKFGIKISFYKDKARKDLLETFYAGHTKDLGIHRLVEEGEDICRFSFDLSNTKVKSKETYPPHANGHNPPLGDIKMGSLGAILHQGPCKRIGNFFNGHRIFSSIDKGMENHAPKLVATI